MAAAKLDLVFERNATFIKKLTWRTKSKRPIDLTGCSAKIEVRGPDGVLALTLSTANGRITFVPTEGEMHLRVEQPLIAAMPVTNFTYDLLVTASDSVTIYRLVRGAVRVETGVTAP
jgi:hypothetical protein